VCVCVCVCVCVWVGGCVGVCVVCCNGVVVEVAGDTSPNDEQSAETHRGEGGAAWWRCRSRRSACPSSGRRGILPVPPRGDLSWGETAGGKPTGRVGDLVDLALFRHISGGQMVRWSHLPQ